MGKRLDLQEALEILLGSDQVYFQPPETVKMKYPCIVYQLSDMKFNRADDQIYTSTVGYLVTVIDRNPDSLIPAKLLTLPRCSFDRHYAADNLNHDSYLIYY